MLWLKPPPLPVSIKTRSEVQAFILSRLDLSSILCAFMISAFVDILRLCMYLLSSSPCSCIISNSPLSKSFFINSISSFTNTATLFMDPSSFLLKTFNIYISMTFRIVYYKSDIIRSVYIYRLYVFLSKQSAYFYLSHVYL